MTLLIHSCDESASTTTGSEFRTSRADDEVWTGGIVKAVLVDTSREQEKQPNRPGRQAREDLSRSPDGAALLGAARREIADALLADGIARLAALRLQRGLSQAQLAELSGLPQPHLSRLEGGAQADVMLSTLRTLAQALEVPLEEVASAIEAGRLQRQAA